MCSHVVLCIAPHGGKFVTASAPLYCHLVELNVFKVFSSIWWRLEGLRHCTIWRKGEYLATPSGIIKYYNVSDLVHFLGKSGRSQGVNG